MIFHDLENGFVNSAGTFFWTSLDMHPNQPIGSVTDIHLAVPSPAVVRQKCIY